MVKRPVVANPFMNRMLQASADSFLDFVSAGSLAPGYTIVLYDVSKIENLI